MDTVPSALLPPVAKGVMSVAHDDAANIAAISITDNWYLRTWLILTTSNGDRQVGAVQTDLGDPEPISSKAVKEDQGVATNRTGPAAFTGAGSDPSQLPASRIASIVDHGLSRLASLGPMLLRPVFRRGRRSRSGGETTRSNRSASFVSEFSRGSVALFLRSITCPLWPLNTIL